MCGIFGIIGTLDAGVLTKKGLHALQHRGQESAGISVHDPDRGENFHTHRGLGLVNDVFGDAAILERLRGTAGVGHVRYSTSGKEDSAQKTLVNAQPFYSGMGVQMVHNGNLTNVQALRETLNRARRYPRSSTDSELILLLMELQGGANLVDTFTQALERVCGAYSTIMLTKRELVGVRDPHGFRPLVLGELGDAKILASETCALDAIGAHFVRDIEPGEMVVISNDGVHVRSEQVFAPKERRVCIFEFVYFAHPNSVFNGINVYAARKRVGAHLAKETDVEVDVVVPVPDSGVPAALGYSAVKRCPCDLGLTRSHYVQRTFIEPSQRVRQDGVRHKLSANRAVVAGKRVMLIDDSLVRGTTSREIVKMVKRAGATEVHMCISSPPVMYPCYQGIDTPSRGELLAANHSIEEMCADIGADSLVFLSREQMIEAVLSVQRDGTCEEFCDACFTGNYPEGVGVATK